VSIAERLAERSSEEVGPHEEDLLRTLTLTNIAAGIGELGPSGDLIRRLPFNADARPADAGFVFAAQLHARTQDDFLPEGKVHVGAIVLSATLALAEEVGDRTLECLAAGYRVMCDVAPVYAALAQRSGLRPSGVFGPFGAAAAAAKALSLSPEETANAIALAAAACGGHNQAWISSSDEWLFEVGAATRAGVEAALFTRSGARAAPDAFEGNAGWAAALFNDPGASPLAVRVAGEPAAVGSVAIKPYPVSGIAQVATDLACGLHSEFHSGQPTSVRVRISPSDLAYPGSSNTGPFVSRSAALMSVAFCVASGLLDGVVRLDRLDNPGAEELTTILDMIDVEAAPDLTENEARVELDVRGATTLVRRGGPEQVLHPTWKALASEVKGLARRSEASLELLESALSELQRDRPGAVGLRTVLAGAQGGTDA
jgi:2-methylcitrate dehydratase PrpD